MAQYFSVLTLAGQAKVAASISGGPPLVISHLAAGDGDGSFVTPVVTQQGLVREVWRGAVASVTRDPAAPTYVRVRGEIPPSVGPATIRELALIANDGTCIAVANWPSTEISAPAQGGSSIIDVEFVVGIDTGATVAIQFSSSTLVGVANLMRVPFIAVDGFAQSPAINPEDGALFVVAANPSGAFAGLAHRLAQWNGSGWTSANAVIGTVIADATSSRYWRRTSTGWVEWLPTDQVRGLAREATDAEADAGAETSVYISPRQLQRRIATAVTPLMPIYPEVTAANKLLTVTASAGAVALDAGQSWSWRGSRLIETNAFAAGARTFATLASKTYHLVWYAPGHAQAPAVTYPNGRLMLRDLTDAAYNPSSLAQTHASFDTTFDAMLIAKVVTSAANAATVTSYVNAARIEGMISGAARTTTGSDEPSHYFEFPMAWSRAPHLAIRSQLPPGYGRDSDYDIEPLIVHREHVQIYSWSWHHSGPMQTPGFVYEMWA